jgi:hypothetical protein
MGKRKDMINIQLEELDHAVFGHMVIARQSTREIKEASMFVEKPSPERRKLEKAKSDNAMVLKRKTYQRSESLISELQTQRNGSMSDFKCSGIEYKDGKKAKEISIRHCRSAEFPTMTEQRNMNGDYIDHKPRSTLSTSANGHSNFHCSPSQSSLSASVSAEVLSNDNRDLSLSNRKSLSFHGSSSVSRESSIEEETEEDDNSATGEHFKPRNVSEKDNRRRVSQLLDELLLDIYGKWNDSGCEMPFSRRRYSTNSSAHESDYCSTSGASTTWKVQACRPIQRMNDSLQRERLFNRSE